MHTYSNHSRNPEIESFARSNGTHAQLKYLLWVFCGFVNVTGVCEGMSTNVKLFSSVMAYETVNNLPSPRHHSFHPSYPSSGTWGSDVIIGDLGPRGLLSSAFISVCWVYLYSFKICRLSLLSYPANCQETDSWLFFWKYCPRKWTRRMNEVDVLSKLISKIWKNVYARISKKGLLFSFVQNHDVLLFKLLSTSIIINKWSIVIEISLSASSAI